MHIELAPHVGYQRRGNRRVEIELPQFLVRDQGVNVAVIGHAAAAPLCFTRYFPQDYVEQVTAEVARLRGQSPPRVSVPPDPRLVQQELADDE